MAVMQAERKCRCEFIGECALARVAYDMKAPGLGPSYGGPVASPVGGRLKGSTIVTGSAPDGRFDRPKLQSRHWVK